LLSREAAEVAPIALPAEALELDAAEVVWLLELDDNPVPPSAVGTNTLEEEEEEEDTAGNLAVSKELLNLISE